MLRENVLTVKGFFDFCYYPQNQKKKKAPVPSDSLTGETIVVSYKIFMFRCWFHVCFFVPLPFLGMYIRGFLT